MSLVRGCLLAIEGQKACGVSLTGTRAADIDGGRSAISQDARGQIPVANTLPVSFKSSQNAPRWSGIEITRRLASLPRPGSQAYSLAGTASPLRLFA